MNDDNDDRASPLNIEKFTFLVGMTVEKAKEEIEKTGGSFRVRVKTKMGVYTADYSPNRVNLHAEHGVVNSISFG